MIRRLVLTVALTLAIVFPLHGQPRRPRDAEWIAPPEASTKANPLAGRPETVSGGRRIFADRCSTCHGNDGRGSDRGPDLTADEVQSQSDGALFWKISSGNTHAGMPSFSFLPQPQRWQIVLHLRELSKPSSR